MGGITAMMYAAAIPEKVEKLIAIDLLKLIHIDAENQPRITSLSLENILEAERRIEMKPVRYKYTHLVQKLIESYGSGLKAESARTLLKRGAREHDDGAYSFTHSPITKVSEMLSMTQKQQEAFASRVECDFLFIKAASSGLYVPKEEAALFLRLFRRNPKFVFELVDGTHHVHLDDPKPVAAIINAFLRQIPQKETSKQRSDSFIKSML